MHRLVWLTLDRFWKGVAMRQQIPMGLFYVVVLTLGLIASGCRGQGCAAGTCRASSYNGPRYPAASSPPATLPSYTTVPNDSPVPAYSVPFYPSPDGSGTRMAPPLQGSGSR